VSCAAESTKAGASLAGTATRARRWLLVEHDGPWGRDALETPLPPGAADAAKRFDGRVMLIRRERRLGRGAGEDDGAAAFVAETSEPGGVLRRLRRDALETMAPMGEEIADPLVLVCTHGRRDRCCARLGVAAHDAIRSHLDARLVWQSSHHGGHRFAANVLVLPWGVQLGRVGPEEGATVAAALREGRIPLRHYRGRTLYEPRVQAAEIAIREACGLDALGALRLAADDGERVRFATATGVVSAIVEEERGPVVPASCGADPEPTVSFRAWVESARG
jgi:hypothetical protein